LAFPAPSAFPERSDCRVDFWQIAAAEPRPLLDFSFW
jgi:hypothetical protein